MTTITLDTIKTYAYHGCMEEERIIGSEYLVDVSMEGDLSISAKTDNLKDTIDYVTICSIVLQEMSVPSNLLEHVAERIINKLLDLSKIEKATSKIEKATISVTKVNPPINADVKGVKISITKHRSYKA